VVDGCACALSLCSGNSLESGGKTKKTPPQALNSREMGEARAVEAVVRFLEDNLLPFTPKQAALAAQELGIEGDIEAVSREVLEEGVKRSMEAVRGLRETFGELPYPESLLEKHLRRGGAIAVELPPKGLFDKDVMGRVDLIQDVGLKESSPYLARNDEFSYNLSFVAWPGLPKVHLRNLHATRERVFFKDYRHRLKDGLDNVRALRPLLVSLKLPDLEEAVKALTRLRGDGARMEGNYVLAKSGDVYALRRGSVLGDPRLDGAILLGKEVELSFPGGVEIAFRTMWDPDRARVDKVRIRLGDEEIIVDGRGTLITPLHENPLVSELQRTLRRELEKREGELPPKTLAFLKAFVRHEDPLRALAEGRFAPHVTAEFFLDI